MVEPDSVENDSENPDENKQIVIEVKSLQEEINDLIPNIVTFWGQNSLGFKIGDPNIDRATMGIHGLTVMASEPKACKSTLTFSLAESACKQGYTVLYFDRENGTTRLIKRRISRLGKIRFDTLTLGTNVDHCNKAIKAFLADQAWMTNMYLYDRAKISLTSENMKAIIDAILKEGDIAQLFVFVDSVQKLPIEKERKKDSIESWLGFFEQWINEYDEGVLNFWAVSEVSRGKYSTQKENKGRVPDAFDLCKESGAFEFGATQMFVLRQIAEKRIELKLMLNRDGVAGISTYYRIPDPYYYELEHETLEDRVEGWT